MIARFVGGPLDGRELPVPPEITQPDFLFQMPPGIDDPGVYVLDEDRTWGPSAEALGVKFPEWFDDFDDQEWETFERAEREARARLESLQMPARLFVNDEHVIFYRYEPDPGAPSVWREPRSR